MVNIELLEKMVTQKNIMNPNGIAANEYWLDDDTFVVYLNFSHDELQELFPSFVQEGEVCEFYAEYQEDEHCIEYILEFEDESIRVTNGFKSLLVDLCVLLRAKEF